MSSQEEEEKIPEKPFYVDRSKTGRAACKKCKQKIPQRELRFGKLAYNPFGNGTIKQWHHLECMFEVFKRQRATTKKIEHPNDIGGWEDLDENDRQTIMSFFSPELKKVFTANTDNGQNSSKYAPNTNYENHKDNAFKTFRKLCADVAETSSYISKTKIIAEFFDKGSDGECFKSDIEMWCRLLLPGVILRVYNLQSKQLIKLFSRILETNQEEMLEDLDKGDVADTIAEFFKQSKVISPLEKSVLTLQEVDKFLEKLSNLTKEEEQMLHFLKITKKCTSDDLKMILRLVKHDLRINAGPKHVLEALHKDAYEAFQTSRDIKSVVSNALKARGKNNKGSIKCEKRMDIDIAVMTPVLPMLAQPCKSAQAALEKCPEGMFSEVKYDGERVQLHKKGDTFKYFSRSLKPVLPHKVDHFKDFIPKAFPFGKDLILDAEILMVDNSTGKLLPFGTLGVHKKTKFKDASVCLFVFDCMYYNGKSLLKVPLSERKKILRENMIEIKHRIMFSEMKVIKEEKDLEKMMTKVFNLGLEGLVLKEKNSFYEPGKRHWLKMKKDYLGDGTMADSADLLVLGAWFGTGSKGGLMSSFLMGCHDPKINKWLTVTKVSNGHDDETLNRIQGELEMLKISKDPTKVPNWLKCTKAMIPDFVAADPKKMPVWEITGAEFTCNQIHTADGISIRFPRVTKIRSDKDWSTATNLNELKELYRTSKDTGGFNLNSENSSFESSFSSQEAESQSKARKRKNVGRTERKEKPRGKKAKLVECKQTCDEETDSNGEEKSGKEAEVEETHLSNPLPNIFSGCVLQIPRTYKNYEFLRRYLIAYDARLFSDQEETSLENSRNKVTHVIHVTKSANLENEKFWSEKVRHVHVDWIWNSIKLLEKQPESAYSIAVNDSSQT